MHRSLPVALAACLLLALGLPSTLTAQAPTPPDDSANRRELGKLLQETLVGSMPRQFEDLSQWNKSVPMPKRLAIPLRRTRILVNGKEELAHGVWWRSRVWIDDLARDVKVEVLKVQKREGKTIRLEIACTLVGHAERERQQWAKGIKLVGITAVADATVVVTLECDVKVALEAKRFPPELVVEARVAEVKLDLKQFKLKRIGPVDGRAFSLVADELKEQLAGLVRLFEPRVKEYANEEIAKGVKAGLDLVMPGMPGRK